MTTPFPNPRQTSHSADKPEDRQEQRPTPRLTVPGDFSTSNGVSNG